MVLHVGANSSPSSEITTTNIPSIETTATSTTTYIATTKTTLSRETPGATSTSSGATTSTPSRETTAATSTPSRETTAATSTASIETINSEITATTTSRANLNSPTICKISSNHETMVDTVVPIEETPAATGIMFTTNAYWCSYL